MVLSKMAIDNLINYVENNEVVYQVCGELVEVSNTENPKNKSALLNDFNHASGIDIVQKGSSFVHEGFAELDEWATDDDVLFLLETIGTLICIPKKSAVENNLIAA